MALWTPADTTTELWLDASDSSTITESGGLVSQWSDKSGNARNATSSGGLSPSLIAGSQNGLDVIRFDGVDDKFDLVEFAQAHGQQIMLAADTTNMGSSYRAFLERSSGSAANLVLLFSDASTAAKPSMYWNGDHAIQPTAVTRAALFRWNIENGSATTEIDAQTLVLDNSVGSAMTNWNGVGGVPSQAPAFDAFEIVLLPPSATQTEIDKVNGYLAWKWGLEANLPVGHPYKDAAPEKATDPYWDDVLAYLRFENNINDEKGVVTWSGQPLQYDPSDFGTVCGRYAGSASTVGTMDAFGTGDFCVDMQVYLINTTAGARILFDTRPDLVNGAYLTAYVIDRKVALYVNTADLVAGTLLLPLNTWNAVRAERVNGVTSIYINGVLDASVADSTDYLGTRWTIGYNSYTPTNSLDGYLDEFRITASSRDGGPYTPQTEEFPTEGPPESNLWTPAEIVTDLWLDANDQSTQWADEAKTIPATSTIIVWEDKSGQGRDASGNTLPPAVNSGGWGNGNNSIYFDGGDRFTTKVDYLPNDSLSSDDVTMFVVYDTNLAGVNAESLLSIRYGASGWTVRASPSSGGVIHYISNNALQSTTAKSVAGQSMVTVRRDGTGINIRNAGGSVESNATLNGYTPTGGTALTSMSIGRSWPTTSGPSNYLTGDIGEIVIVDGAMTDADMERMEGYLAWKWDLVADLPVDHPYKNSPPEKAPEPEPSVDPYWDDVVLLIKGQIQDESQSELTLTQVEGPVVLDATYAQFNPSALRFAGSGKLDTGVLDLWDYSQPFTAEFICTPTAMSEQYYYSNFSGTPNPNMGGNFRMNADGSLQAFGYDTDLVLNISTAAGIMAVGVTTRLEVDRNASGLWTIRVNGVTAASGSETRPIGVSLSSMYIGGYRGLNYAINAHLEEYRVTQVLRYATDYTPATEGFPTQGPDAPPVPVDPYWDDVTLLINSTVEDLAPVTTPQTITNSGVTVDSVNTIDGQDTLNFDIGSHLALNNQDGNLDVEGRLFTLEFKANWDDISDPNPIVFGERAGVWAGLRLIAFGTQINVLGDLNGGNSWDLNFVTSVGSIAVGTDHWIVLQRKAGNVWEMGVDGNLVGSQSVGGNAIAGQSFYTIGSYANGGAYNGGRTDGRYAGIRLTMDVARYTWPVAEIPTLPWYSGGDVPVDPPVIDVQPQDTTVDENTTAAFDVTASGTGTLSYQWYRESAPVGTDSSTYSFTALLEDDGDEVYVVVTDDNGETTSDVATLTVTDVIAAPIITTQPTDVATASGAVVAFSVEASGEGTLTYQWYDASDDSPIAGQTEDIYYLIAEGDDNGNTYYVIVTNAGGSVQSDTALLEVVEVITELPRITSQTRVVTVNEDGPDGRMTVLAENADAYQWYRNDVLLSGEVYASLFIPMSADPATDNGDIYTCVVTNSFGSVTSDPIQAFFTIGDPYWDDVIVYAPMTDAAGTTNIQNLSTRGDAPTLTSFNSAIEAGVGKWGGNGWMGNGVDSYILISELPSTTVGTIEMWVDPEAEAILGRDIDWSVASNPREYRWPQISVIDGLGDIYQGYPSDGLYSVVRSQGTLASQVNAAAQTFFQPFPNNNLNEELFNQGWVFFKSVFTSSYIQSSMSVGTTSKTTINPSQSNPLVARGYTIGASAGTPSPPVLVLKGPISELRITLNPFRGGTPSGPFVYGPEESFSPIVNPQPNNVIARDGEAISFTVGITSSEGTVTYQWNKDGVPIAGAVDATYNTTAATADDGARFDCTVSDDNGSVTSSWATLTINLGLPVIIQAPVKDFEAEGATAEFKVVAYSDPLDGALAYQWYRDDVLLAGEVSDTLNFIVSLADDGILYKVDVSNDNGTVTPPAVPLIIGNKVIITQQPQSQSVEKPALATFTVVATGDEPLLYQWYDLSTTQPIAGEVSDTLTVNSLDYPDGGSFYVRVENANSHETSQIAELTAATPPSVVGPEDVSVQESGTAVFEVFVNDGTEPYTYKWFRDGIEIAGATESIYTLADVTRAADSGSEFYVVVTDFEGAERTSRTALLTVRSGYVTPEPVIEFGLMQMVKNPDRKEIYVAFDDGGTITQSSAPECQPYDCGSIKGFIEGNGGYPMDDPQVNGGVYAGDFFNGGSNGLRLALPSQPYSSGNYDEGQGWAGIFQYNASAYADYPDLCIENSNMVRLVGASFQTPRCWLDGARDLAATDNADFSSTHIRIGASTGVTLEWSQQMLTALGGNYFINSRSSCYVNATQITLQTQNKEPNQSQVFPTGEFEYNQPYVITTHMTCVQSSVSGSGNEVNSRWDTAVTMKITDVNGLTFSHTFLESSGDYSGYPAYPNPNYAGYIVLHRSGEANSLGCVFNDVHDGAVLAIQRNYLGYQVPDYCEIPTRTSLVYNFEDDNYTWMDASVAGEYSLDRSTAMKYGFDAGWSTKWDTPLFTDMTWDDFNSAQSPWNETQAPRWSDMADTGTEQDMFMLTDTSLWNMDKIVYTGTLKEYFVERVNMNFDDVAGWTSNSWKHIKQFYFHLQSPVNDDLTNPNTFNITAGWAKGLMDDPDYNEWSTINLQTNLNTGRHKWDFRSTGRYLALKMDFQATQKITMTGGDMDAEEAHKR